MQPERRWLDTHLGFTRTARAREKILAWFRARTTAEQAQLGEAHLQQLALRLRLDLELMEVLPLTLAAYDCTDVSHILCRLALGEIETLALFESLLKVQLERPGAATQQVIGGATLSAERLWLRATNRDGLLRDVALLLSRHGIGIISTAARTDDSRHQAQIEIELDEESAQSTPVARLMRQARVLDLLADIPTVVETWRA